MKVENPPDTDREPQPPAPGSSVSIGDVSDGISGSTIAGRDVNQTTATGEGAVAIGGPVTDSTIITGDNNTVTQVDNRGGNVFQKYVRQIILDRSLIPVWIIGVILALVVIVGVDSLLVLGDRVYALAAGLKGPEPMSGRRFNIAVADFVIQEGSFSDPEFNAFSHSEAMEIQEALKAEFAKHEQFREGDIEFRNISLDMDDIGDDIENRHEAVARIASELHAHIVVYGVLDTVGVRAKLKPEFYVHPDLLGADEVTGPNAFGQPIEFSFPLTDNPANQNEFQEQKAPRLNALTAFMIGLALFKGKQYDAALAQFDQVNTLPEWANERGRAILSLWIGSAYQRRALHAGEADDFPCIVDDEASTDEDCALAAYLLAIEQDPHFARAHIGIGNYWLDLDQKMSKWRLGCEYYAKAVEQYLIAKNRLDNASPEYQTYYLKSYVAWKIDYSIGLAHARAWQYDPKCDDITPNLGTNKDLALQHLTSVWDAYRGAGANYRNTPMARDIASRAAYQVGILNRDLGKFEDALEDFQDTIDTATPDKWEDDWQSLRWIAHNQRGKVYEEMAKAGDKSAWEKALAEYDDVIRAYENESFGYSFDDEIKVAAGAYLGAGRVLLHSPIEDKEQIRRAIRYTNRSIELVLSMDEQIARSLQDMPLVNYRTMFTALRQMAEVEETSVWKEAASRYGALIESIESGSDWRQEELRTIPNDVATTIEDALKGQE